MKKMFKWLKWILLSILGLIVIILLPIGIHNGYQSLRVSTLTEQEKYLEDLERLEYIMANEFSGYTVLDGTAAFDKSIKQLKEKVTQGQISSQTDFNLSIIEAVASFKDPHTSVYNRNELLDLRFPYYLNWSEGSFYLLSGTVDEKWLGAKVIKIGNLSSKEAFHRLSKYANSPNEAGTALFVRSAAYAVDILDKEGFIENRDKIDLLVQLDDEITTLSFQPVTRVEFSALTNYNRIADSFGKDELPMYLTNLSKNYWYRYLEASDVFYLRYSMCVAQGDIEAFWSEVFDQLDETKPSKLIIDVRGNPGGDTQNHASFINRLRKHPDLNQYGKLFTFIDRGTGSAAVSLASDMQKMTNAILVGEKTMDKPNTTSDPTFFTLPHAKVTVLVPSLYSLHSYANDSRNAVIPNLAITQEISRSSYTKDEVLDSVLNLANDLDDLRFATLPAAVEGKFSFSPVRNTAISQQDSIWYFTIDGLIETPIYRDDSTIFTNKYRVKFTEIDTLGRYVSLNLHGTEMRLDRIENERISLEQAILDRDFEAAENILASIQTEGSLPYYLDRPYFQQHVYRLYNEYGFDEAYSLNQLAKKIYPDDPVVSIIDFELYQYEGQLLGQVKTVFPIVGKLLKRYFEVITTEKVMNDDYNAFIGR